MYLNSACELKASLPAVKLGEGYSNYNPNLEDNTLIQDFHYSVDNLFSGPLGTPLDTLLYTLPFNNSNEAFNDPFLYSIYSEDLSKISETTISTMSSPSQEVVNQYTLNNSVMESKNEEMKSKRQRQNKQQKLESNRIAAQRCRIRKKQWIQTQEQQITQCEQQNEELEKQITSLKEDILDLKMLLAAHRDCDL
ncbi:hypothetical protein K502DRAFT_342068 [Neoconidiobolus thromboides FSU 785]|nr:hypothetical protein K502DRAFT_342068 [Neoconidiobolus thromboides FSU 785]